MPCMHMCMVDMTTQGRGDLPPASCTERMCCAYYVRKLPSFATAPAPALMKRAAELQSYLWDLCTTDAAVDRGEGKGREGGAGGNVGAESVFFVFLLFLFFFSVWGKPSPLTGSRRRCGCHCRLSSIPYTHIHTNKHTYITSVIYPTLAACHGDAIAALCPR